MQFELLRAILQHICDYGLCCLPVSRQPRHVREAIFTYALKPELSPEEIAAVENQGPGGFWTSSTKQPLLLLRGLFAGGVLAFCLGQKRWRVNYGPDASRTPPTRLAVPYRAKDSPTPRSEFSHPDVVIILTSLSFYYAGLSDDDLSLAFGHLLKSDQAEIEYQAWVQDATDLPFAYRHLGGVNIEDRHRCVAEIYPLLRYSKGAIDYFLSHIVFPREIKGFSNKLSASGWDIGEIRSLLTCGFSGTNDTRAVLPLSVEQLDLPQQNHTNALVLEYLLRPENSVIFIPPRSDATTSDADVLLNLIQEMDPPAQVLLDVGAQILELTNIQVATAWLKLLPDHERSQAVVFFNGNDDLMVLDRSSRVEPLQISPFANQLELCSGFLDEAHTRGTDLRLPSYYRAAVTLGPGITKDKLVQACMRMRKLGKGQFCIPDEIKVQIIELCRKEHESDIDVSDVMRWAICGTWKDLRRTIPLWATQGKRFESQRIVMNELREEITGASAHQATSFLEPESQSLDDRYRPRNDESPILLSPAEPNLAMQQIMQRMDDFEITRVVSSQMEEEQERELAPEVEQEREIQKRAQADPALHSLHPDVMTFVRTGRLISGSTAYTSAFKALENTSASAHLEISQFPTSLLVTNDFVNTVKVIVGSWHISDESQRPVQWVLTSKSDPKSNIVQDMLIVSPYEANCLRSKVAQSKLVAVRKYAPRQSLNLPSLDTLELFSVPDPHEHLRVPVSLRIQLNLFAGQLYIGSYQEYLEVCDFLGVASEKTPDGLSVAADGFIVGGSRALKCTFRSSPLMFLRVFLSKIREDGQDIDKTLIGKILMGQLLKPEDFESAPRDDGRPD